MAHIPVLLKEVLDYLDPRPGDVILDATLGGGGHSEEIVKRIGNSGRLIAMDKDFDAIERAGERLKDYKNIITFANDDFRNIDEVLDSLKIEELNGALFDLGVSSYQIDDPLRGFSFMNDGPLDMRMDKSSAVSAKEVVNSFKRIELEEIIREYGEERHAALVAKAIFDARKKKKIETTGELKKVITDAIGRKYRKQKLHPAARTFQGLRIYVNDELGAQEKGITCAIDHLAAAGRICVISFHSLEDRITKNIFKERSKKGDLKLIEKKPIRPGREEIKENPRSRSSKLRVAERIR